jgi:putative colanic acid biosynthesis acetyltransferase WcaF
MEGEHTISVDLSEYPSPLSWRNKLGRVLWGITWALLFRPSPRIFFSWRSLLLRIFGATIGPRCAVYPSCKIWAPWNLELGEQTALADDVDCYCVDKVVIGSHVTISQYTYLCTASHDISTPRMRLITAPITIKAGAWACADVFVGPGVTIGEGAVAAARAVVVRDVPPWTVVGGNPAKFIKPRKLQEAAA